MKNPSIFVVFECFELRKATATTPEAVQLHTNTKNELPTHSEHFRNLKFGNSKQQQGLLKLSYLSCMIQKRTLKVGLLVSNSCLSVLVSVPVRTWTFSAQNTQKQRKW